MHYFEYTAVHKKKPHKGLCTTEDISIEIIVFNTVLNGSVGSIADLQSIKGKVSGSNPEMGKIFFVET
jgi:hypothetical protein